MKCPNCKNPISEKATSCEWCGEILTAFENNTQVNDVDAEIIEIIKSGNKLKAVKVYKEKSGLGLKESKDYIDKISANIPHNHNIAKNRGGCMSSILFFIVITSGIYSLIQILS